MRPVPGEVEFAGPSRSFREYGGFGGREPCWRSFVCLHAGLAALLPLDSGSTKSRRSPALAMEFGGQAA